MDMEIDEITKLYMLKQLLSTDIADLQKQLEEQKSTLKEVINKINKLENKNG